VVARLWHGVVATLAAAAVIVQIVVALRVPGTPHEVSTGLLRGASTPGRVIRVLSFFTIQSNLLCGSVSLLLAGRPDRDGPVFRPVRLAALFGITVTGIVYATVLARIHQPNGPAETFVNTLVHYVIPVLVIVGWLVFGPRPRIDAGSAAWSLLFPAAWICYTLLRGAVWGWYPYPFVNAATQGYARVVLNCALVLAVLSAVVGLFALGDRRLPAPTLVTAARRPAR
jgi:hypothetical protein